MLTTNSMLFAERLSQTRAAKLTPDLCPACLLEFYPEAEGKDQCDCCGNCAIIFHGIIGLALGDHDMSHWKRD